MSDDKKKAPKARKELKVPTAYPPYVNLLPPEVGEKKAAARARGRAIFVAIIAIGVVILASVGMNLYALQRYLALENARSLTQSLLTQQGEYNDVRVADQMVQSATGAQIFATSTEVSVEELVTALRSKLPESALGIIAYSFETATPLQSFGEALSVLEPERIAQFAMELNFASVADADTWLRSVADIDGVLDGTLVSAEYEEELGSYTVNVVVYIDSDALVHRFDEVEAETQVEEATEEGSGS
ncbi:fimbrial assembly protein [Salinibacterium sp. SWN248]|uniref:fimbrial assembly protein n=1 Tax=Salinibacterium sp. SWN248 TaxID=2792056 RepID=UPI0018CD6637|nr:fimbrial assembly protein [Salinibacterium sp. SWN248]MBH0023229.1 fimbrial assembly protein [Salinibacterium sp. SWN248]